MKQTKLIILLMCMILSVPVFAQSTNDITREANPKQQNIQDNSEKALLWQKLIEAKHQRNESLYQQLLNEYNAKYPIDNQQVRPQMNWPSDDRAQNSTTPPFQSDWGSGDVRVHAGALALGPTNNSQGIFDLEVDSLGNKYAVCIQGSRDSIFIYKSIDQGITWTRINRINAGGTTKWQSIDMFITDSLGVFRIGIAGCRTSTSSSFDGEIFWMTMRDDGSGYNVRQVISGNGYLNPSIISDGWEYSAGLTYWYIAYQRVNTGTGVGTQCLASLSRNWGFAWEHDTVRSGFNDFNLSMNYADYPSAETLYVAFTNDITPADPNLRINRINLGGFGSATNWTQFNVANTASAETDCDLAVNRTNDQMAITYTIGTGNTDIAGRYWDGSTYWGTVVNISNQANNESRARLNCQERQGAYRMAFVSNGSRDTVIYISGFTLSTLGSRQIVNESPTSGSSTTTSPDVAGFRISAGLFGGGVVFSLLGPTDLYYDASNITPIGINQNETETPSSFSLSQNYPNPFNPTTNIKFALPKGGLVKLVVFDVMGREVAVLVNKDMNAGSYTADFDASNLSTGVYFYKLTTGDFSDTKKMMLIK